MGPQLHRTLRAVRREPDPVCLRGCEAHVGGCPLGPGVRRRHHPSGGREGERERERAHGRCGKSAQQESARLRIQGQEIRVLHSSGGKSFLEDESMLRSDHQIFPSGPVTLSSAGRSRGSGARRLRPPRTVPPSARPPAASAAAASAWTSTRRASPWPRPRVPCASPSRFSGGSLWVSTSPFTSQIVSPEFVSKHVSQGLGGPAPPFVSGSGRNTLGPRRIQNLVDVNRAHPQFPSQ